MLGSKDDMMAAQEVSFTRRGPALIVVRGAKIRRRSTRSCGYSGRRSGRADSPHPSRVDHPQV